MPPWSVDLQLHAAATWFMAGVIWVVQLVHYPLFAALDRAAFARHHAFHASAITRVVLLPMLAELALAAWLAWRRPDLLTLFGFGLVLLLWAVTLAVMAPLHGRLQAEGFRHEVHVSLLRWNWLRTVAWSVRAVLVLWL
jgi:hypothetical protein